MPPDALLCAAIFARPDQSANVLRVKLGGFLGAGLGEATLNDRSRGIATALRGCSKAPEDQRLDRLRESPIDEYARWHGHEPQSVADRLDAAASASTSINKVASPGSTVAGTVLRLLGIGISRSEPGLKRCPQSAPPCLIETHGPREGVVVVLAALLAWTAC